MKHLKLIYIGILAVIACISCKKLIEVETPKNQLTTDKVFADTVSATAALVNIYDILQNTQYNSANKNVSAYSDESLASQTTLLPWNQGRLTPSDVTNNGIWSSSYSVVYQCNLILEQIKSASGLPASFLNKLEGEAKFLRAYTFFYLINLYGKIPMPLNTDVNLNRVISQSDSAKVYSQIISDLTDARSFLPTGYQGAGKVRANKACATALLARAYFYQRNWAMAESLTTEIISSGVYTPIDPISNTFKGSGKESILQLATQTGFVTEAGSTTPTSGTVVPAYYFTDNFYQSFETGDLRKANWISTNLVTTNGVTIKYNYPSKYKNRTANTTSPENLVVLRASELYLIRGESRAWQGRWAGAASAEEDINVLRIRAGLPIVHPASQNAAINAVANERLHEMFFEDCDRFFDLKRTGKIQNVMAIKSTWLPTSMVLPIPLGELTLNSNLKQNNGY